MGKRTSFIVLGAFAFLLTAAVPAVAALEGWEIDTLLEASQ